MSTYMGNEGHLMQHWTLCELLTIATKHNTAGLNFIDAYAMAPLAREKRKEDPLFNRVRDGLPGQQSSYERAWHYLAPSVGYPNSAVFVEEVWERDFAILLCETDWPTIAELGQWLASVGRLDRCRATELSTGDWRLRFCQELPNPATMCLQGKWLTLVWFDPDWYDNRKTFAKEGNGRKLYKDDIRDRVLPALEPISGRTIIQISTYSKRSPHEGVIQEIDSLMAGTSKPFNRCCAVKASDAMMSLIYARNVPGPWMADLAKLNEKFKDWRPKL